MQSKILILGAAGSIGSALTKRIARLKPKQLVILDQDETGIFDLYEEVKGLCSVDYVIGSIRDREKMIEVFYQYKPDIVYHVAAYKHVVLMELWPYEAQKTNVEGTKNLIDAAILSDVKKFIFVSSDKAVNPVSVMGKTKLAGERMCLDSNGKTKFIVVRFGNVMPSRGSIVPIFQKQIAEGKNLTVTDPHMRRYFMGIYDAVDLMLKVTEIGRGGEIFLLDMGEVIYIKDLAKLMIKLSGKPLEVVYTHVGKGEKFHEELYDKKIEVLKKVGEGILLVTKKYGKKEKRKTKKN